MDDLESYSKAKRLFRDGVLSEAVYALEAEVSSCRLLYHMHVIHFIYMYSPWGQQTVSWHICRI